MSFLRGFLVSVLGTGTSRVLGFVRDLVITRYLGAGGAADVFWQAFTVPGLFRRYVADEGLTGALVPGVARAEIEEDTEAARTLANQVLTALLLVNGALLAVTMLFPEPLVWLVASGFASDPEKFDLTVQMTRWLMPFVATVSVVSFFEGLLNHRGHFFVPKVAPGIVSACIAASIVLFGGAFEEPAWALVWGVAIGGVVHALVNLPVVWRLWGPVALTTQLRGPRFRFVLGELGKVVAIGIFGQVNIIVLRTLASYHPDGAVSHYNLATRMIDLSQGVIAVAIGSAMLPMLAVTIAGGEWDRFRDDLVRALRLAAFLLIPAAVGLFLYAVPLVSLVFLNDRFDWEDLRWTASTIQMLVPYMLALAGVNILRRVFFALDRRDTILKIGGLSVVLTGLVGYVSMPLGVIGLGLALSASTSIQLLVYVALLRRELGDRFPVGRLVLPLVKMAGSTIPMGAFAYWCARQGHWTAGFGLRNVLWFLLGAGGGAALYGLSAWLLGLEELLAVTRRLRARAR